MNFCCCLPIGFGRRLLGGMTRKLGWESKPDEEHLTKLLRSLLLGRMAMFDDPEVIAEAERRFDLHIKGQEQVPADFRSTVYKAVLRTGSRSSTRTCCKFIAKRRCTRKRIASPALWAPSKTKKSLKRFLSLSFSNRFLSNFAIVLGVGVCHVERGAIARHGLCHFVGGIEQTRSRIGLELLQGQLGPV